MAACGTSDQTSESTSETETKEAVSGGWEIYENEANVLPEDVQASFDKALETFTGSELKPVAYVASQVVAGTNYAFLCFCTLQTEETINGIQVVTVYKDLDGNAEITNICTVDPADYNE